MGTTYQVQVYADKNLATEPLKTIIDQRLQAVNQAMSTYMPTSEISTWNQQHSTQPQKISDGFAYVTGYALELAEQTQGAYDPTIGPLTQLWGFGPDGQRKIPTQAQIDKRKEYVGYALVELKQKKDGWWLQKKHPNVQLDLSSVAKGYGVDVISDLLMAQHLSNHFVEIGGEIRTHGGKGKKPWIIGIESPDPTSTRTLNVMKTHDASLATSGNYRNFFLEDGQRYGHTFDPATGRPAQHRLLSASVLEIECMKADALATALMVMGPERAMAFAKERGLTAQLVLAPLEANAPLIIKQTQSWKQRVE